MKITIILVVLELRTTVRSLVVLVVKSVLGLMLYSTVFVVANVGRSKGQLF